MAKDFGLIPEISPSEFEECFACRCSRGSVAWSSITKLYRTWWRFLQQGVIHFDQIPLNSYLDCFQIQEYSGFCWAKKCHLGNEFLKLHQWAQSWDVNIEGERCWSYYNEWWWLRSWWRPDPRWQFLVVGCRCDPDNPTQLGPFTGGYHGLPWYMQYVWEPIVFASLKITKGHWSAIASRLRQPFVVWESTIVRGEISMIWHDIVVLGRFVCKLCSY